jgi:hypothetical protein
MLISKIVELQKTNLFSADISKTRLRMTGIIPQHLIFLQTGGYNLYKDSSGQGHFFFHFLLYLSLNNQDLLVQSLVTYPLKIHRFKDCGIIRPSHFSYQQQNVEYIVVVGIPGIGLPNLNLYYLRSFFELE